MLIEKPYSDNTDNSTLWLLHCVAFRSYMSAMSKQARIHHLLFPFNTRIKIGWWVQLPSLA